MSLSQKYKRISLCILRLNVQRQPTLKIDPFYKKTLSIVSYSFPHLHSFVVKCSLLLLCCIWIYFCCGNELKDYRIQLHLNGYRQQTMNYFFYEDINTGIIFQCGKLIIRKSTMMKNIRNIIRTKSLLTQKLDFFIFNIPLNLTVL